MVPGDPIQTLLQRQEFLYGIQEIARLCNWPEEEIKELGKHVWQRLVKIDNDTLAVLKSQADLPEAIMMWESGMEDLRYNLSLILGVKIKYI